MFINFDKRGGGSGGVTTGQVESMISELAQGYYTASTYSALTAITGTKDGDVGIVGSAEYQKMYGEWSPMYKQVAISQADYDLIQTKDPNTIYNITGTTS